MWDTEPIVFFVIVAFVISFPPVLESKRLVDPEIPKASVEKLPPKVIPSISLREIVMLFSKPTRMPPFATLFVEGALIRF